MGRKPLNLNDLNGFQDVSTNSEIWWCLETMLQKAIQLKSMFRSWGWLLDMSQVEAAFSWRWSWSTSNLVFCVLPVGFAEWHGCQLVCSDLMLEATGTPLSPGVWVRGWYSHIFTTCLTNSESVHVYSRSETPTIILMWSHVDIRQIWQITMPLFVTGVMVFVYSNSWCRKSHSAALAPWALHQERRTFSFQLFPLPRKHTIDPGSRKPTAKTREGLTSTSSILNLQL